MSASAIGWKEILVGLAIASLPLAGCTADPDGQAVSEQAVTPDPSPGQVPLDPRTIPQFAHELTIPRVLAPRVVTSFDGKVRHEYTVSVVQTEAQMLPPGFPVTRILAYKGEVKIPGSSETEVVSSSPGPVFDNTRGIPTIVRWRNEVAGPHFLPVDPTLHWANPATLEPPTAPFLAFPGGYDDAQNPVAVVTHNHGLVVKPENDGIAEAWFTASFHRGPSFATNDYFMPNEQPGTQLFYHDHTMGMTRISLFAGLTGTAYYIRDPNSPLDQAGSPLPSGEFEIPLILFDRAFFTDGQLRFPRTGVNKKNPYWQPPDLADAILVNGKVWPNLDVQRRQYRFRTLAIGNGRLFNVTLDNAGTLVPFTVIGSDGGYLPQPQVVTRVGIATTERADILVDFSQFAPGTQIIMRNAGAAPAETVGNIMRFTVLDTPAVPPPPLPNLVARATLTPDAPTRIKTLHSHTDIDGDIQRSVDGLEFTVPPTEFPLVGSTEEWDLIDVGGNAHQIHLHLIEFQLLNRQPLDGVAYLRRWHLLNGHRPVTRPIPVDPTPFFTGPPVATPPYETGWKDTLRVNQNEVLRLIARWAPQEVPAGGVKPGQNLFPIDPVNPTTDQWYLWHCHVLGHEDNDMMRKLPMVNLWRPFKTYVPGTVVAFQNVDYRVRRKHSSKTSEPPSTRFDLWERVNNNDGSWQPQIIYAVGDRVLHDGQLYRALTVHQAQSGKTPDLDPGRWETFPMTACGQITKLCADNSQPAALSCQTLAAGNDETSCLSGLEGCLAQCDEETRSPCSGLCNRPTSFTVPDGTSFNSGSLGRGDACFETESEILTGRCSGLGDGRQLTLNGKVQKCDGSNWSYPLPPQRNKGYCIQVTAGPGSSASFQTW